MEEVGKPKVTIFYDGMCNLCSGLADTLDESKRGSDFILNDISNGVLPAGVSKEAAMRDVHVLDESGHIYRGAEAVLRILKGYPRMRWIATIGAVPGFKQLLMLAYRVVEKTRYFVFGRKS